MKKYQSAYLKAKTKEQKTKVFNKAYLNLGKPEFDLFLKWQVSVMNQS